VRKHTKKPEISYSKKVLKTRGFDNVEDYIKDICNFNKNLDRQSNMFDLNTSNRDENNENHVMTDGKNNGDHPNVLLKLILVPLMKINILVFVMTTKKVSRVVKMEMLVYVIGL
jgi:hypothetical protein